MEDGPVILSQRMLNWHRLWVTSPGSWQEATSLLLIFKELEMFLQTLLSTVLTKRDSNQMETLDMKESSDFSWLTNATSTARIWVFSIQKTVVKSQKISRSTALSVKTQNQRILTNGCSSCVISASIHSISNLVTFTSRDWKKPHSGARTAQGKIRLQGMLVDVLTAKGRLSSLCIGIRCWDMILTKGATSAE